MDTSTSDKVTADGRDPRRTTLLAVGWTGTLLLSRFPEIVLRELAGVDLAARMAWIWIALGVALTGLALLWRALQPLGRYFAVMTGIHAVTAVMGAVTATAPWRGWFGDHRSWVMKMLGERLSLVLMGLAVVGALLLLGQRRGDVFLGAGAWRAPVGGERAAAGGKAPWRWSVVGPLAAVGVTSVVGGAIIAMSHPSREALRAVAPLLPAILLLAVMNAFGEELTYRAAPLSQLRAAVGTNPAIWMTAAWFGLGHYYGGVPSGPAGAASLTLVAVLFGKAMVETAGLAMPVFIHMWGDIVVYTVLAMAA